MKKLLLTILLFTFSVTSGISMSLVGLRMLKSFEGCRLTAYKCPAGVWTNGWGNTKGVKPGMRITQKQADDKLDENLKPVESKVRAKVGRLMPWYQEDACFDHCYNGGIGMLSGNLLAAVKAGAPDAGKYFLAYNKARDPKTKQLRVLKGLDSRCIARDILYTKRVFNGR